MSDGIGTTTYGYGAPGALGALQVTQVSGPLANSAVAYGYDSLGRVATRTVAGAGPQSFSYDALSRLVGDSNDLGAFSLTYLWQTRQVTGRTLAGSTLAMAVGYLPNGGDRRLAGIGNTGLTSSQSSVFGFTTTPMGLIAGMTESSDVAPVTPAATTQTPAYNALNQQTALNGGSLSYDANGNLLSDGHRRYSWDAENRLVGISYPGQSGKLTAFAYDGMGRRVTIASTPAGGGSTTTTSYLWCGGALCQARTAAGATSRSYYAEGEYLPGATPQPLYYGTDQLGSVRRVFASTGSAPAYGYDAWGNLIQAATPLTDFTYAGLFRNADSGLLLATYHPLPHPKGICFIRHVGEDALA